jgi:hypothetical protein
LKRRSTLVLAGIVAAAIVAWLLLPEAHRTNAEPRGKPTAAAAVAPPAAKEAKAPPAPEGPRADDAPSHLADALNDPSGDIHADLRLLDGIFQQYRSALHSDNPIGENVDITAALCGRNKLGFAFIAKDNPAIDSKGELCDRWGTPFFFHQLSGGDMQIRSAGPDRKLWTDDDEVLAPGLRPPHL